jgi:hypothetical protein
VNKIHRLAAKHRSLGALLPANEVVLVFLGNGLIIDSRGDRCVDASQERFNLGVVVQVRNNQRYVGA